MRRRSNMLLLADRDASRYPEKDKDEEPHGYYTHWLSEMKVRR